MKKLFFSLFLLHIVIILYPQDFFRGDFDKGKSYIILMNPTAGNIQVIDFLVKQKLLDVNMERINFVGVYHTGQEYDFSRTAEFIKKNSFEGFFLREVRGGLPEKFLFRENECTDEFRQIFRNSIGIIFFGGEDIPPSVYGEDNLYSSTTDPGRHYFEVSFLFHLLGGSRNPYFEPLLRENPGYLVTGFCLGMQTMNIAAGGTLYQDIPAQLYDSFTPEANLKIGRSNLHRNYWQNLSDDPDLMGSNLHPVRFTDNQFFGRRIKLPGNMKPTIYSSHHQAVKDIGNGLEVTALSPDGRVIEGLAHAKYPNVFSVQFHPEVSSLYKNRVKLKFDPSDKPETLHRMLGIKSIMFHKRLWSYISGIIETNSVQGK